MIPLTKYVLFAMLPALPCEYVIDFGAEAVPFAYDMVLTLQARDGTQAEYMLDWIANSKPATCRDVLLEDILQHFGWAVRAGPGNSLVVVGVAKGNKSPIRSVTLKSDKVIPVQVRWVPLVPEKKK